jgi:glycosyltransferase involved in cell wall biosynthesis
VLHRDFGMSCSAFGFSYDREIYNCIEARKQLRKKKRLVFYARPNTERRGFELGILALSLVSKKKPDTEFVLVGFLPPRSMRFPFTATVPGIVPPPELARMYRESDVALVLSHTNLSMLPLELMACGCPVVSNAGANVEWLLSDEVVQLARPTPQSLAAAILRLLEDDELRRKKAVAGLAFAQQTRWEFEIGKIEDALYKGVGISPDSAQQIVSPPRKALLATLS